MANNSFLDFNPPIVVVRELMREYADQLAIDLCFQNFEQELANLPGRYAAPSGALVVAYMEGQPAGCGAFRPLEKGVCEMKRLYTRDAYRGHGLGKQIARSLLIQARRAGYMAMRLDTLASMTAALALYESLGFQRVKPYYDNPTAGCIYLQANLTSCEVPSPSPPIPETCKASAGTDNTPIPSSIRAH